MTGDEAAFGALVRTLRLAAGLTIEGLAEASGVSVRGIGDLERGLRTTPQRRTVAALADGLGLAEAEREQLLAAARAGRDRAYAPAGAHSFPRGIDDFTGRGPEVARLTGWARETARTGPAVMVISGPPGAGKTTLALQTAREVADAFPDGQLVVDLRGTDDAPPEPAELVLEILRALQAADRDLVRAGPQGQPELYRKLLADRRFLLVLDNARDEAQVRPLLPGAGPGMVLVTSRRMLTGLDAVRRLPLGELAPAESTAFLTGLIGADRAGADPAAVAEVADRCGHLPLALRVAGNWLATRTGWPVRRLADRLADEDRRLDALAAGDIRVSAAFELSYQQLTPAAARIFRRLALVPGSDFSPAVAAKLAGQDLFDAEDALEELFEAGLLGTNGGRYRLHDLLWLYARTRLVAEESTTEREAARRELYDWLLETAVVAGRWFEPDYGAPPPDWAGIVDLSSADRAHDWLQAEGLNWLAALRAAAAAGDHATVVEVAEALHWFSDNWVFWGHWHEVYAAGARSARALGDPLTEATQLNYHAWALFTCEGRPHDSIECATQALAAARRADSLSQQAWAHQYLASAYLSLDDFDGSMESDRRAADLFEAAGDHHGAAQSLLGLCNTLNRAGRPTEALASIAAAFVFLDETGDRFEPHIARYTRTALHTIAGDSHARLGDWDAAVDQLRTGLEACDGKPSRIGRLLSELGHVLLSAGRPGEAREAFASLAALGPAGDPARVSDAREQLARLDGV
ncbi:hypothetical protein SRB5_41450 [Streptomyces sp. RB5]|uniref:HTH cro/C1-type domain-containing protein n=1 Tax=Streptomyces smaragdinus TaxID=2585196 RepID=A0A7K0CKF3_9ACTN|nr:helix-turn-helix domain-containing protein [Streptomyces smaragdinus]MQY13985.1 hypothetical protein [Streptomyces smaragdinus]